MTVTVPATPPEAPSLAEQAYRTLRDRLITLEIRPGDPIHDGRLAAELGIGRTPVREAVKRLETDHLVISYARRGTFATIVDITELADVSDLRRVLEPLAARKAALGATDELRGGLRDLAREVRSLEGRGPDKYDLMRCDLEVHRLVYRAAGNPHLEETCERLGNLATRIWCLVLDRVPSVAGHVTEHVELLDTIAAGDGDRAAALALEHVVGFEEAIRAVL